MGAQVFGTVSVGTSTDGQNTSGTHSLGAGTLGNRKVRINVSHEHTAGSPPTFTILYGGVSVTRQVGSRIDSNGKSVHVFELWESELPANGSNAWSVQLVAGAGAQGIRASCASIEDATQAAPTEYTNVYTSGVSVLAPSGGTFAVAAGSMAWGACGTNAGEPHTFAGTGPTWTLGDTGAGHGGDFSGGFGYVSYASGGTDRLTMTSSIEVLAVVTLLYDTKAAVVTPPPYISVRMNP